MFCAVSTDMPAPSGRRSRYVLPVRVRFRSIPMRLFLATLILAAGLPGQGAKAPVKIVGDSHKLILFSDGTVGGWGDSRDGQLGPRSAIFNVRGHATAFVPIAVPGPAVDMAAGGRSSYVLLDDGTVVAFGYATEGQLGCGGPCLAGSETPVPVTGLRDVVSLAARDSPWPSPFIAMAASARGEIERTLRQSGSLMYPR